MLPVRVSPLSLSLIPTWPPGPICLRRSAPASWPW
jgi:hypothetical protein